jgi:hypothetical protein
MQYNGPKLLLDAISIKRKQCYDAFGYVANPDLTVWENSARVLANTPSTLYFNQPKLKTYHNLCVNSKPPLGTGELLGLGHKFIIQKIKPTPNIDKVINNFKQDIRTKYMVSGLEKNEDDLYVKQLYIKSIFPAPPANNEIETRIDDFSNELRNLVLKNNKRKSTNLNRLQQKVLKELKTNSKFIVFLADKNLGPAIMEREEYIRNVLVQHLLDKETYRRLTPGDARKNFVETRRKVTNLFLYKYHKHLAKWEIKFFQRFLSAPSHRKPCFYALVKVHKAQPYPFRPVVSAVGSLLAAISTWIDYCLQKLKKFLPTYLLNSEDLIKELLKLGIIPTSVTLFTSDVKAMYTNINIEHCLKAMALWLNRFQDELPPNFPSKLILEALELVLTNNVFTFGNTFWLQITGTAMGTPCACILAMLYFGLFERLRLLMRYKGYLLFFKRFIDDIFAIWDLTSNPVESKKVFAYFQQELNSYGILEWKTEKLTNSVNFLDLTISITPDRKLNFKTFQKEMNLYLYIPPKSAHPPGVIKSMIFGCLRNYWHQNSDIKDFKHIANLLYQRLLRRGHDPQDTQQIFLEAMKQLHKPKQLYKTPSEKEGHTVFLKLEYHPRCISRQKIQQAFKDTCMAPTKEYPTPGLSNILVEKEGIPSHPFSTDKLTVCYTVAKSIRDHLIPSKLKETTECNVQSILTKLEKST